MYAGMLKITVLFLLPVIFSEFGLQAKQQGVLVGTWVDNDGGMIVIRREGSFLDVSGRDAYSIYTSVCLLSGDRSTAKCLGHGVQMESGKRFLYRSSWQFQDEAIEEKWEAYLADGVLQGGLLFKRMSD